MKTYFCMAGILYVMVLLVKSEMPEKEKQQSIECANETGFNIEAPGNSTDYDADKARCYHACIMRKSGSMVNGKIIAEREIELLEKHITKRVSDSFKATFIDCINKANNEINDECKMVEAVQECLRKAPL